MHPLVHKAYSAKIWAEFVCQIPISTVSQCVCLSGNTFTEPVKHRGSMTPQRKAFITRQHPTFTLDSYMGVSVCVWFCQKVTFKDKFQAKPVDWGQLVFLRAQLLESFSMVRSKEGSSPYLKAHTCQMHLCSVYKQMCAYLFCCVCAEQLFTVHGLGWSGSFRQCSTLEFNVFLLY